MTGAGKRITPHGRYGLLSSRDTNTSLYVVHVLRPSGQIRFAHLFKFVPYKFVEPSCLLSEVRTLAEPLIQQPAAYRLLN